MKVLLGSMLLLLFVGCDGGQKSQQDFDGVKIQRKKFKLCHCPFDCLEESGIAFHKVTLSESDLSRLPDRQPWRLEKALQHKCYSLLTGDDLQLFPDLLNVVTTRRPRLQQTVRLEQQQQQQPANTTTSPQIPSSELTTLSLVDHFLLPLFSFLSFFLIATVVLCQKHCLILQQQQQQQQHLSTTNRDYSNNSDYSVNTIYSVQQHQQQQEEDLQQSSISSNNPQIVINIPPQQQPPAPQQQPQQQKDPDDCKDLFGASPYELEIGWLDSNEAKFCQCVSSNSNAKTGLSVNNGCCKK